MELMIAVALFGILSALSIPMMLSAIQGTQTRGAAQELANMLQQARQLAITKNSSHRVDVEAYSLVNGVVTGNRLRFCSGTAACTDTTPPWKGPGTDSNGYLRLSNEARIACATNLIFSSLGAATTPGTLKVQNSQATSSRYVTVSASGRIKTASTGTGTCP